MSERYAIFLHVIPDNKNAMPKSVPLFLCRSKPAIKEIVDWLESYSKEAETPESNPRRSRGIAVVRVNEEILSEIPEGRRPATDTGDSFTSIKEAARALGVSRAYLHRMLNDGRDHPGEDFAFPTATIRGVTVAFVEDLPE